MKRQQGKYIPDFWRRRRYLLSMVTRENASNLRKFPDALSLISKVFGLECLLILILGMEQLGFGTTKVH